MHEHDTIHQKLTSSYQSEHEEQKMLLKNMKVVVWNGTQTKIILF